MADACVFVMEKVDISTGGQADKRTGGQADKRTSHGVTESQSHKVISLFTLHPSPFSFLNIGTGHDLTIRELAVMVKDIVGYKGGILWDPTKPDGTFKKQLDVTRLHQLGWKASIPMKKGIESVYNLYWI